MEEIKDSANSKRKVSREELYEEVWSEPITKLASKYKVSDSYLVRICKRLKIPTPGRGYWAMVTVGRKMARLPLPIAQPGDELEWARDGQARIAQFPQPGLLQKESRRRVSRKSIPDHHPLLNGVRDVMLEAKEADNGLLKPLKHVMVDIISSKATLDRALDIANELYLSFERRGHSVKLEPYGQDFRRHPVNECENGVRQRQHSDIWGPYRCTLVFMGTVAYGFTLFETTENVEVRYQDGKYTRISELPSKKSKSNSYFFDTTHEVSTGKLCLQVYSPYPRAPWMRQWREKKAGDFPRKLSGIVKELEAETTTIVKLVEEGNRQAEIEKQQWEEEKRRREQAEKERLWVEANQESKDELAEIIKGWAEVKTIEQFFADTEEQAKELPAEEKAIIHQRLKLAREMIGCTDALKWFAEWKTPEERFKEEEELKRLRWERIHGKR